MSDRLTDIKAREQAATPGPWTVQYDTCEDGGFPINDPDYAISFGPFTYFESGDQDATADAEFSAHARTDVPWLVEQLEQARGIAVALENEVARLTDRNEHLLRVHGAWVDGCRTSCHNQQGGGTHA